MNWFEAIRSTITGDVPYDDRAAMQPLDVRQAAGDQVVRWEKGQPAWMKKNVRSFDTHAHRRVSLIFSCVQYLSNAAATAPVKMVRDLGSGQSEDAPDHELQQLLARPNPGQGTGSFISFLTMMAAVTGFAVIEKERDNYGRVIGLWVLRSDWLRPIPQSAATTDWEYRVPGHDRPFIIEAEDTIPLTYSDVITGDPTGLSPIEVIFQEAQILNELDDFIKVFLDRGAMPQYFALPDTEGPLAAQWKSADTVDAFRKKFNQTYGGLQGEHSVMVAPAIKDLKQLGFNIDELAYRDLRDVHESSITTAFGIPPILLNTLFGLEHATYSNYEQARRAFYEDKMVPWWSRLDDVLTRHLLPEFETDSTYNLMFDLSDVPAMREDENAAHERARQAFSSGLISRHTAQRMAGIDPHGTDAFLLGFSQVEVPVRQQARSTAYLEAMVKANDEVVMPRYGQLPEPRYVRRDGRLYVNERARTPQERAQRNRIAQHHQALMMRVAGILEPKMHTFLREQGQRIVSAVMDGRSVERRAVELIDWNRENEEMLGMMRSWWAVVTEEAFGSAADELGVVWDFDQTNPFLAEIEGLLGHRVVDINETTRETIERVVTDALQDGTTIPDLQAEIERIVDPTYRGRAENIARTESQVALNTAHQKAYQASGQVSMVELLDGTDCDSPPGSDGLTCPQRNGLVVSLADVDRHIQAEHPRGTLAYAPILDPIAGVTV